MRQSLRIIEQCLDNMPAGPYKSDHPLATPPPKEHTMHDIETLIDHFLGVSWGPVIPPARRWCRPSPCKGATGYYWSATATPAPTARASARRRSRTCRCCPCMCRGLEMPDLIAILGSIDFVMADVDR